MPQKPSRPQPRPPGSRRRFLIPAVVLALLLVAVGGFVIRPFWQLSGQFDDLTYRQPSRLYARPATLAAGLPYDAGRAIEDLEAAGYREQEGGSALPSGRYRRASGGVAVHLRDFLTPQGARGGGVAEISFRGRRIRRVTLDDDAVESLVLEPPLVASYYSETLEERRPVTVEQVPKALVDAILAAEDERFFRHSGISLRGIARAAWVNLRGGELRQGGSTLTQQLVKNIYLSHERTVVRKLEEAVLALLLEMRYSKREILEAYLNEIYLGSSGGVNLLGVGAASRAYFAKDASQLDLAEAATLAGMIRAPAPYSPVLHPERCRARRDWVLGRLGELGRTDPEEIERALAEPLQATPEPVTRRRAPFFADAMAAEAARRWGVDDLADGGYVLFSTLDWRDQQAAQKAVGAGLEALEKGWQKGAKKPLETALVSVDPKAGGILAYVGGRDYRRSQFDRAARARRQAGSAFKPIVYAALFESRRGTPASFIEDSPLTVKLAGRSWSPKNDDGSFHGWVSVRAALEHSYNPATTRVALQVGMPEIVELAHAMGVVAEMPAFPSVALGAASLTPVELASVYATLASGGVRPPVHGLTGIYDRFGKRVEGETLATRERVLSPQSAYLVTTVLQGVIDRGTGQGARAWGVDGELAGKTGTTNDRRDAWFAGYSPERATVVWVGYDDNSPTRLSGARGALPLWSRFTKAVRPPGGYSAFPQPPGIQTAVIDPTTGQLATEFCPTVLTEVFREGEVPAELCTRHTGWYSDAREADLEEGGEAGEGEPGVRAAEPEPRRRHPFRRWLRRVFGGDEEREPEREPEDRPPGADGG